MKTNLSWFPIETSVERGSRIKIKSISIVAILSITGLSLAGCGSSPKFGSEYGKASPYWNGSGPIPKGGGRYKVGNPYVVNGKKYYPREDPGYDRVGNASWYGPTFNRRQTANGEYFDMTRLTGAHPTLPLPSFVRVTNLKNRKSVVIRVNDRGPYASNRVIDVSKKTADVLGFRNRGTARVRVQYVGRAPLNGDDYYTYSAKRRPDSNTAKIASAYSSAEVKTYPSNSARANNLYVQAASFASQGNARRLQSSLGSLGPVKIVPSDIDGQTYYRVRVGPLNSNREAKIALRQIVDAGHTGATLVID